MKTAKETDFTSVDFPAPRNPEMIVAGTLFSLSSKVLEHLQTIDGFDETEGLRTGRRRRP